MVTGVWFKQHHFARLLYSRVKGNIKLFICILVILSLSMVIYAYASMHLFSVTVQSRGIVKTLGVGIYWDEVCSLPVSSLDWGIVEPNAQKNITFFVRNEGNVPGIISLSAVNWDPPSASSYMTLSWNYLGKILEPGEVILVTLTLFISPDIQGVITFNFETVISIS